MKIAIGGKGGTGKTTLAGTLARVLGRSERSVLAIDGDSNPNLAAMIGIEDDRDAVPDLPTDLFVRVEDNGERRRVLTREPEEILRDFTAPGPDGVRLLVGARADHAGTGCLCREHSTVRNLVGEMIGPKVNGRRDVILDLEAGLEHLTRGTPKHVDALLVVVEPYFRSLEAGQRIADLARELEVPEVHAVANKVRTPEDREAIREFCERHDLSVASWIPWDDTLLEAERAGRAPIDFDADAPAMAEIRRLGNELLAA